MESMGSREAELITMNSNDLNTRLHYVIPSRGLLGFMTNFLTLTKGYGIINHTFLEYRPMTNKRVGERSVGVLVSTETGQVTGYALQKLEDRGTMFVEPGDEVYEGMIVGENKYEIDLAVNAIQSKNLTNMRAAGSDHTVVLKAPRKMSLEACLDYINSDELVEITPKCYRLRKKILNTVERKKYDAHQKDLDEAK